jgi:group I intron endonuclease
MANTHSKQFTIYLLTNRVNGKYYVGQTLRTARHRWSVHKCEAKTRSARASAYLYKAIRKHGADAFIVETLATATNLDDLNRLEELWILVLDAMNPAVGYNAARGGRNHVATAATRAKVSASLRGRALSPERRARMSAAQKGVPKSAEHAAHIAAALKGRRPSPQAIAAVAHANTQRTVSPETRAKLRAASIKGNHVRWSQRRTLKAR